MRVSDLEQIFGIVEDSIADAFDRFAERMSEAGEDVADELKPLRAFGESWSTLEHESRTLVVRELLKSAGIVALTNVLTKLGIELATKKQKKVRKMLIAVADLIEPVGKKAKKKTGRKLRKAAKKLHAA